MKAKKLSTKKSLTIWLVMLAFILPVATSAQNIRQRHGTVTDMRSGESLSGVLVMVKGTSRGTQTDAEGRFQLEAADGETLTFSLMGHNARDIILAAATQVNVALEPASLELGEVVVTALGIERNTRTLSYASQNMTGDEVNQARDNSSNILGSLAGKAAGAVVTTAATGPGGAVRVILRGNRSISGNNTALIVVDGVPYENQGVPNDNSALGQATGVTYKYGVSDGAVNINPDDVESINILRGASATALYGSRAANGAIIITTKQGKEGRFTVDYNGSVSLDAPNLLFDLQNTYGRGSNGIYSATAGESWGPSAQTYPDNVRDFFETAASFNNAISMYGGTKQIQGLVSYANNAIGGIVPGNDLKRNTINARVNTNFFPKLTTDTKITYVHQAIDNKPRVGDTGTPNSAYIMPRDMSPDELKDFEDTDPNTGEPVRKYWTSSTYYDNPYWNTNRTSVNEVRNRVSVLASAKYEIFDWLDIQGRISYDRYDDVTDGSFYHGTVSLGDVQAGGKYYETYSTFWERNADVLISGRNEFGGCFDINYNVGASTLKRGYSNIQNMANGLTIPNMFSLAAATTPSFLNIIDYERMLNSVYGYAQVGYNRYLYLELTARNDWSSTLPPPYSYFYPSVGLSAIVSDMVKLPDWVNFGKVRLSYTQVGNDADPYLLSQLYIFTLGAGQGLIYRNFTRSIQDLKPEKTKSFELGLDWRFLNNRLSLDATFYKSNTINQLLYVGLPYASGFQRRYINAGNIQNRGFELQLSGRPVMNRDFSWHTAINFSTNRNLIIELAPNTTEVNITSSTTYATVVAKEGSSFGDLYGYVWSKDDQGRYIVDANGLPVVEANQYLGNYNPDALISWQNSFRYKDFGLSFLIDGRIGGEMVSGTDAFLAAYGLSEATSQYRDGGWVLDAVHADGSANTTAITAERFWTTVSQSGRNAWGEFFTYDMTNFRLRELTVSYDFRLRETSLIKSAQLSFTSRNLFFFYRGKSKLDIPGVGKRSNPVDPEIAIGAGNYQGVEVGLPPTVRTFGLNLKLSF